MKKKTEAKRQAIIEAAAVTFLEFGFERASMSKICSRVGGSKATIYNYFASKEELFSEVMSLSNESEFRFVHEVLENKTDDMVQTLYALGQRLLHFLYSAQFRDYRRLAIVESGRTDLGKISYERGIITRSQIMISEYLAKAMDTGKLNKADPLVAAKHLYGLLEAELILQFLWLINEEISEEKIKNIVKRAVDVFMAAYCAKPSSCVN